MESLQELAGVQYWLLAVTMLLAGLALLTFGGDWLADGAASLGCKPPYRTCSHWYYRGLNCHICSRAFYLLDCQDSAMVEIALYSEISEEVT